MPRAASPTHTRELVLQAGTSLLLRRPVPLCRSRSFPELCAVVRLQDLLHGIRRAGKDHPGKALVPAVAEAQVRGLLHLPAEEGGNGVSLLAACGKVQDNTGPGGFPVLLRQKVEHCAAALDAKALLHKGLAEEVVQLLRRELPDAVFLLPFQQSLGQVIAQGPGGEARHQRQVVEIVFVFHGICLLVFFSDPRIAWPDGRSNLKSGEFFIRELTRSDDGLKKKAH